jgi:hypothetical protein
MKKTISFLLIIIFFASCKKDNSSPSSTPSTPSTPSNSSSYTWNPLPSLQEIVALDGSGTNLYAATFSSVYTSSNNGTSWTNISTGFPSRSNGPEIDAIAVIGTNIFVGDYQNGLYMSPNNGATWSMVSINTPRGFGIGCGSVVVNGTTIYALINATMGSTDSTYLAMSSNDGVSWKYSDGLTGNNGNTSIVINGSNIFVSLDNANVYLSTNNGASWTTLNSGLPNSNFTIYSLAAIGTNIFAGGGGIAGGGVYMSSNNGATWTALSGLPNQLVTSLAVNGTTLYVGFGSSPQVIYSSSNNGASWTNMSFPYTLNFGLVALVVNGTNVYALGNWANVNNLYYTQI